MEQKPSQEADERAGPRQNKVALRGRFAGQDVIDANRKHLEPKEVEALFEALRGDLFWYPYFYLQYYFGCRVSEIAIIAKEDFSFEANQIIIRRLKKKSGSGYTECVYDLTPGLKRALKMALRHAHTHKRLDSPWLFPSPRKSRKSPKERLGQIRRLESGYQAISRMSAHSAFKEAADKAGIPKHLQHAHVLRHTRATLMLAAGHDPKVVQYLLGHSSISTTMGYIGLARSLQLRYQMGIDLGAGFVVKDRQAKQSMRKSKEYAVSADGVAKTEFAAAKITHTPRLDDYEEIDPLGGDA